VLRPTRAGKPQGSYRSGLITMDAPGALHHPSTSANTQLNQSHAGCLRQGNPMRIVYGIFDGEDKQ
jgi:hypothetical protein